MSTKNLKPCPFCGSEEISIDPVIFEDWEEMPDQYIIMCEECHAVGPSAETEKESIERWNKRLTNNN